MRCLLPSGFLANGHLPRVSHLSDEKDGNRMGPGAVHRSSNYLTGEENTEKPQLETV